MLESRPSSPSEPSSAATTTPFVNANATPSEEKRKLTFAVQFMKTLQRQKAELQSQVDTLLREKVRFLFLFLFLSLFLFFLFSRRLPGTTLASKTNSSSLIAKGNSTFPKRLLPPRNPPSSTRKKIPICSVYLFNVSPSPTRLRIISYTVVIFSCLFLRWPVAFFKLEKKKTE